MPSSTPRSLGYTVSGCGLMLVGCVSIRKQKGQGPFTVPNTSRAGWKDQSTHTDGFFFFFTSKTRCLNSNSFGEQSPAWVTLAWAFSGRGSNVQNEADREQVSNLSLVGQAQAPVKCCVWTLQAEMLCCKFIVVLGFCVWLYSS